jgi:hypothetical protein
MYQSNKLLKNKNNKSLFKNNLHISKNQISKHKIQLKYKIYF